MVSDVVDIQCTQLHHDDERCPLLPPDHQQCIQRGSNFTVCFDDIGQAREAYKMGMNMAASKHNKRKYLHGGLYRELFFEKANIIDIREYGGSVNLNVKVSKDEFSVMKLRNLRTETCGLGVIKNFNEKCDKSSSCRANSGDSGSMFAFGLRNIREGNYKSMKFCDEMVREYSLEARKLLSRYFSKEVSEIIKADRNQTVTPTWLMGGDDGLSAYCLVSRDLVNSAHYDLDTSVSITIFNEKMVGTAEDWFFVLPNTMKEHDKDEKAIVIRLFDGCTICWDGRKIFHATATRDIGLNKGNHTYGNFWGGKNY